MGIHLPRVKFSATLSTIFFPMFCFKYSLTWINNWRNIRDTKEYRSHTWVPTINSSKHIKLIILTKLSRVILIFSNLTDLKWTTINSRIKYGTLMKILHESERYSQNMLDSPFFRYQTSHTSFPVHLFAKKNLSWKWVWKPYVILSNNHKI